MMYIQSGTMERPREMIKKMGRSIASKAESTPINDLLKDMLRSGIRDEGWTAATIAGHMRRLGHAGWDDKTPHAMLVPGARQFTVDEASALLAIFGGKARAVTAQVNELISMIALNKGR
jgi:hypothetical protein